jgi:hypothetical protein
MLVKKNPNHLLAERVGFEPTIPLPVYHLSRVARSTAPAPLRNTVDDENIARSLGKCNEMDLVLD